jgi:Mrp family chromosome partitioning ATPase
VLPTRGPTSTEDHLSPDRVENLFGTLRRAFDIVIVDTAPVLGVVETRVIAKYADVTLLIGRWRKTSVKAAQAALDLLDQAEARVGGVALSVVDIRQHASTGLGDAYGYHKKFTGYYVN